MTSVLDYSTTAGSNTTVGGVSIAEGMAPGSVNNGMRAMMADSKKWQLDWSGITTAGTGDAYTITTNQVIASYVNFMRFTFRANRANTGAATLNVDGRGAKTIKKMVGAALVDLAANDLFTGGTYDVSYYAGSDVMIAMNIGRVSEASTVSVAGGETSLDFTGIPSWATDITLILNQISLSGTDNLDIRLGDSGGFISTGYIASYGQGLAGSTITSVATSTGVPIISAVAAHRVNCTVSINRRASSNGWNVTYVGTRGNSSNDGIASLIGGGSLIVDLTQIRIRPFGSDTFDVGSVSIRWR